MAIEEVEYLAPAVQGLLGPVSITLPIEERMAGAIVAVEFVILAELLQRSLGAVNLVNRRVVVVIAENTEQWAVHLLGEIDRRHRPLVVEVLRIIDDDIAAPAIHRGIDARQRASGQIGMATARAETDHADLAGHVR